MRVILLFNLPFLLLASPLSLFSSCSLVSLILLSIHDFSYDLYDTTKRRRSHSFTFQNDLPIGTQTAHRTRFPPHLLHAVPIGLHNNIHNASQEGLSGLDVSLVSSELNGAGEKAPAFKSPLEKFRYAQGGRRSS